ncbi:EamA family transporter [Orrella sp. JC864]|uniref:EamA family transporter n=1 Tax=Orrella sp. JC864 TaxID=3120298 RepID=UPI0012BC1A6E
MPLSHFLLALSVVFIWGTNFVVIKWGLADFPPFLFAALRFLLSALPWIFFFRRPAVPWPYLAGFGTLIGVGQFGLLYWAMQRDITPGLASLVIQSQVFFTILLSMAFSGERLSRTQAAALGLAAAGYAIVAWHGAADREAALTLLGLALVLAAAVCWACANVLVRRAGRLNMVSFTVWSSLFAIGPLTLLSLLTEGAPAWASALAQAGAGAWASVLWQAVGNTIFGFGAWNWLLMRHPAATVTPMALLVPVFGMLASALLLAEALPLWKLTAAGLVMAGLMLNFHAGRMAAARAPQA